MKKNGHYESKKMIKFFDDFLGKKMKKESENDEFHTRRISNLFSEQIDIQSGKEEDQWIWLTSA